MLKNAIDRRKKPEEQELGQKPLVLASIEDELVQSELELATL